MNIKSFKSFENIEIAGLLISSLSLILIAGILIVLKTSISTQIILFILALVSAVFLYLHCAGKFLSVVEVELPKKKEIEVSSKIKIEVAPKYFAIINTEGETKKLRVGNIFYKGKVINYHYFNLDRNDQKRISFKKAVLRYFQYEHTYLSFFKHIENSNLKIVVDVYIEELPKIF